MRGEKNARTIEDKTHFARRPRTKTRKAKHFARGTNERTAEDKVLHREPCVRGQGASRCDGKVLRVESDEHAEEDKTLRTEITDKDTVRIKCFVWNRTKTP